MNAWSIDQDLGYFGHDRFDQVVHPQRDTQLRAGAHQHHRSENAHVPDLPLIVIPHTGC